MVYAIINPAPPKTFRLPLVKRSHASTFLDQFDFWATKGPAHVPRNRQLTSMQAYLELFEMLHTRPYDADYYLYIFVLAVATMY